MLKNGQSCSYMKFLKENPMIKSNHTIIHNHTRDIIMMTMKLSTEKKIEIRSTT